MRPPLMWSPVKSTFLILVMVACLANNSSINACCETNLCMKAVSNLTLSAVTEPASNALAVTEPAAILLAVIAPSTIISDLTLILGAMMSTPLGLVEMVEANCSPVNVVEPMVTPSDVT